MARSLYFFIPLVIFLLDRWTKILVERRLFLYESKPIIPGFLDLTHTRNTGVAFGFLANSSSEWMPYLLTLASALALVLILVYSLRHPAQDWRLQLGLMLVLGGAAGNLYDRVAYGYVIDFIDVFYRTYHWPTFNVADSSISVGIGLLLLQVLVQKPQAENSVKTIPVKQ
jgi:signal peptidase II